METWLSWTTTRVENVDGAAALLPIYGREPKGSVDVKAKDEGRQTPGTIVEEKQKKKVLLLIVQGFVRRSQKSFDRACASTKHGGG